MAYTIIDDPSAYFQTALWTGDNSSPRTITNDGNSDLQPDLVWIKQRSTSTNHFYYDSSRGFGNDKEIPTNTDTSEGGLDNDLYGYVSAATSDGFTVTAGTTNNDDMNQSTRNYVAWQWKCNGGTTSTNTDGDINSTVQVNQDAGFTIVQYSPSDSTQRTIGHGMGSTPDIVWVRNRNKLENTWFWHGAIGFSGALLDLTNAYNTNPASTGLQAVGASTFTVGTNPVVNGNYPYIAYCWKEVQGYSKFGKYIGNGNANGTFVYTGFKPAFVMIKKTNGTGAWIMYDDKRNSYTGNYIHYLLQANYSDAEVTNLSYPIDFLSNGFKLRGGSLTNDSGGTYIYMAFAENPFVTSTGIPTTAR